MFGWFRKRQPPPPPKKTWGANPDCPQCGQRLVTYDIINRTMYCPTHRVLLQCRHWPVPADYFKVK
jgi:hypothetical protein